MTTKIFPQVNLTVTDKFYYNIFKKCELKLKDFYKIMGKSESKYSSSNNNNKHIRSDLTCFVMGELKLVSRQMRNMTRGGNVTTSL
jgi:hypothetical protein